MLPVGSAAGGDALVELDVAFLVVRDHPPVAKVEHRYGEPQRDDLATLQVLDGEYSLARPCSRPARRATPISRSGTEVMVASATCPTGKLKRRN
ncbi:hypothetical protein [Streptomyces sp. NPDC055400]